MKYIFEEIIKIDDVLVVIDTHFSDAAENEHMKYVVRDIIHHKLVDMVLDELDHEQKMFFLAGVEVEEEHQGLLDKLRSWIDGLEEKLHFRAKEATNEVLRLIDVGE